jgi:succinyl-diaminopimelate desuccinylase
MDTLQAAREDFADVVELTRELIRVPSRGGIDPYDPVLGIMAAWLGRHGLPCRRPAGPGDSVVALTCEISGEPGPRYVLDACLDTAPFGDEAAWSTCRCSGPLADHS